MKILLILAMFMGTAMASVSSNFLDVNINRVYDGDTFYVDFKGVQEVLGKNLRIRTKDFSAPELREKGGLEAKKKLEKLIFKAERVDLMNCVRGKYFRLVCSLYINGKLIGGLND